MLSHTGNRASFATSGDGEGLEFWSWTRERVRPLDGSIKELQVRFWLSDTVSSYELFDKKCLRLDQVASIDPTDQLVALYLQENEKRHLTTVCTNRLDTFAERRGGGHRARVAEGGAESTHIGAARGNAPG